jgi:hypothetical protein
LSHLSFTSHGLADQLPPFFTIPLPIILDVPEQARAWPHVKQAVFQAAEQAHILAIIDEKNCPGPHLVPRYRLPEKIEPDGSHRMIELFLESADEAMLEKTEKAASELALKRPDLVVCIGLPLTKTVTQSVVKLAKNGLGTFHLYADRNGREINGTAHGFIKDIVLQVHRGLVAESLRDCVTLLAGGGIAMAEHIPKLIACGADGVIVNEALLAALECRMCRQCLDQRSCPVHLQEISPAWGQQRIINLLASWYSQLLEVLGAMGLREVRRLRGDLGRVMFFQDLEKECYAPIFGKRR